MKRITFSERDAAQLFEWGLAVHQIHPEIIENCWQCAALLKRLRKCIGKTEADRLVRLVKKYPYVPARDV